MGDVFDAMRRARSGRVAPARKDDEALDAEVVADAEPEFEPELELDDDHGSLPFEAAREQADEQDRHLPGGPPPPPPAMTPPAVARDAAPGRPAASRDAAPARVDVPPPAAVLAPVEPARPRRERRMAAVAEAPPAATIDAARQTGQAAEYAAIRDGMIARGREKGVRVHLLTSPTRSDRRTETLIHVAASFAELDGSRVLLVEADLRVPTFTRHFQRVLTPGLAQFIREREPLQRCLHRTRDDAIDLLPAGCCEMHDSFRLLGSDRMADAIATLRERYDHVLIDAPPPATEEDAGVIASLADEAFLVVRDNDADDALVEDTKRRLHAAHAPLAGVIVAH